jgi:hypothetical protein
MAHWAEIDENNIVIRVLVGSNDDADEGYQWLIDNLGGTWLKTSYNTRNNQHKLGGVPFRGNFAGVGASYLPDKDVFISPSLYKGWILDDATASWVAPFPEPDSGSWTWDDESENWIEYDPS